jgi:MSHA biogenesis protein MshN
MSLINQMLKDLESRNLKDTYDEEKMLGGVQAQSTQVSGRNKILILSAVVAVGVIILAGGWYLFQAMEPASLPVASEVEPESKSGSTQAVVTDKAFNLVSITAEKQQSGDVLTLNLSSPAQGIVLRQMSKQARVELRAVTYSPAMAMPISVNQLFPGIQVRAEGNNTILIIPLSRNQSLDLKDASGKLGQLVVLTRKVTEAPRKPSTTRPLKVEKKIAIADAPERTVAQQGLAAVEPAADRPLPVVKKAVPLSAEQQALRDYQQAQKALSRGDDAAAIQLLRSSIGKQALPQSYLALAGLLVNQGSTTEARNLLEQGLKALPGNEQLAYLLASLQLNAGLVEQSRQSLISALSSGRGNAEYLALLAAVSHKLERYPESTQAYVEALRLSSEQPNWWMGLGLSLEAQNKNAQAIEAYYKSLSTGLGDQLQSFVLNRIQGLEGVQQ